MPPFRVPRIPGSHAVRILLAATFVAGVAAVIVARDPAGSGAEQQPADAVRAATEDDLATSTSTATGTGENARESLVGGVVDTDEGAVLKPDPAQLPDTAQAASATSRFAMPLREWSRATDRYGADNRGPGRIHGGIDLALEGLSQSPVYSACTGTVSEATYSGAYGNHVFVDCGDGWTTLYGHLSQTLVAKGAAVDNNVVLGITGSSGYSTGEHLHFEVRWQDTPVNPEDYLDFGIAPGTPLSDGPLWFPNTNSNTPVPPPTITPTPTDTPTPTLRPPSPDADITPDAHLDPEAHPHAQPHQLPHPLPSA